MTVPTPLPRSGASSALAWANRLRAVGSLAAIVLAGEALDGLRDWARPHPAVAVAASEAGETIFIVDRGENAEPVWPLDDGVQAILSRLQIELDPVRWVLYLHGDDRRVLPRGWPTILVDRQGRLVPHDLELDARQVDGLRAAIARAAGPPEAFAQLRGLLAARDPRLKEFWGK